MKPGDPVQMAVQHREPLCLCDLNILPLLAPVSAQYQGSEKYVYSALNGVKLCKPRPALDRLSISTVYISKKQKSLRVARPPGMP